MPLRPALCTDCGGSRRDPNTWARRPCVPCKASGVVYVEGPDTWANYRAHYGIEVTPKRLAFEETLNECFGEP